MESSICEGSTLSPDLVLRELREVRLDVGTDGSRSEDSFLLEGRLVELRFGTGVGSSSSSSSSSSPSCVDGVGVILPGSSSSEVSSTTKLFRGAARRDGRDCAMDDIVIVIP
jgi:hypothetical protein